MAETLSLEAIGKLFDERLAQSLKPIEAKLDEISEDISEIKEESAITRHSTNLLLKWAKRAEATAVNVGGLEDA